MSSASDCTVVVGAVVGGAFLFSALGVAGCKLDSSSPSKAVCARSMT